jgi:septum formation inhibitor-activating ATPase MinD
MRIACLDQKAADRLALQKRFDDCFEQCRNTVGHFSSFEAFPCTKDEALLNNAPAVFAIGNHFSLEESYRISRELATAHPETPILLFVDGEQYTLRTLRRFQAVANEVFSVDEQSIRIVHTLSSIAANARTSPDGKIIVVEGVKGGVGSTSIVSGIAHAAEAVGKRAVVVDFSTNGVFSLYMGSNRWHSSDHAAAIVDKIIPDRALVEKCLTTAPNGITVLLPPSGGTDVRECWLRDSERFEIGLGIFDTLRAMFDIVVVDLAAAEGILPFALGCRAYSRILVTSNDPASVHLLGTALTRLSDTPGEGQIHVLVNHLLDRGLTHEDVLDFLYCQRHFNSSMAVLEPVAFDPRGRNWIGSGNSFYTESARRVQVVLEDTIHTLLLSQDEINARQESRRTLFSGIWKHSGVGLRSRKKVDSVRKALPFLPSQIENPHALRPPERTAVPKRAATMEQEMIYEPPQLRENQ